MILRGAFSPEAILGAGSGATIMSALHLGISRGIFSHESGLGSAAIAAAAAKTQSTAEQGLISMMGAFLSIIVCTMTGLVLIVTQSDTAIFSGVSGAALEGGALTSYAFGIGLGMTELGKHVVNLGIVFFAFTTIIGWNYYGEKCMQYLLGDSVIALYRILFVIFVIVGPFLKLDMAFIAADIVIGLMIIPNLIGIIGLRKTIVDETKKFLTDN
jgi:AGCS family alanine or glycine:cation symporter